MNGPATEKTRAWVWVAQRMAGTGGKIFINNTIEAAKKAKTWEIKCHLLSTSSSSLTGLSAPMVLGEAGRRLSSTKLMSKDLTNLTEENASRAVMASNAAICQQ